MDPLTRLFRRDAENAIRQTRRFESAPADDRAGATFAIVGVEEREYAGFGSRATRPALVVECRCGALIGRFSLLLGDLGEAASIDEPVEPPDWFASGRRLASKVATGYI